MELLAIGLLALAGILVAALMRHEDRMAQQEEWDRQFDRDHGRKRL